MVLNQNKAVLLWRRSPLAGAKVPLRLTAWKNEWRGPVMDTHHLKSNKYVKVEELRLLKPLL